MKPPPQDVIELMERIRREGQGPRVNGHSPAEPPSLELPAPLASLLPPPEPASSPVVAAEGLPIWEALTDLAARARRKITVGEWLPVFLRPLARNQGGFNGIVLDALERLGQSSREWQERTQEQNEELRADLQAQNACLQGLFHARESDLAWMRAVEPYLQRTLSESAALRVRAEEGEWRVESRLADLEQQQKYTRSDLDQLGVRATYHETHAAGLDERLSRLQSQADEQSGRFREKAERADTTGGHEDRAGELLGSPHADLRRAEDLQKELEAVVRRLDEREVADAAHLKNQVALLGRLLQRQLDPAGTPPADLPPTPGELVAATACTS